MASSGASRECDSATKARETADKIGKPISSLECDWCYSDFQYSKKSDRHSGTKSAAAWSLEITEASAKAVLL